MADKKTYAVYIRVSSEDQKERQTIETQNDFAEKYCDLHQLNIFKIYKEDGISGTIPLEERPEGQQLVQDAADKLFNVLLVYKLDRLGRSARVTLNSIHQLENMEIDIKSMTEPFDTSSPSGRFMITMLAGVADLERETILERMWLGANRAAKEGKWLGGITPYGYFVNKDKFLEITTEPLPGFDMSEADVVKLIYHMIADKGFSCIKLSDYLNALKIPPSYAKDKRQLKSKDGKRRENTAGIWRPGRIRNMIVNSTYMGIHEYGKRSNKERETIKRSVPAIVDQETWERAQEVLKSNQLESVKNSTKTRYLLRGLIKCGVCGLTFHGISYSTLHHGYPRKSYYECGGKTIYRGPLDGKCYAKNINRDYIEKMIWENCLDFINDPGKAIKELTSTMKTKETSKKDFSMEISLLKKALAGKTAEKERILELFRKNIISEVDVEKQIKGISEERLTLEENLKELESKMRSEQKDAQKLTTAEELLNGLKSKIEGDVSFDTKREIIKSLIDEIIIYTKKPVGTKRPTATIHINYSFY